MRAKLRQVRLSPKKANLVASMIRNMRVQDALALLDKLPKKGARILRKLLSSAIANAENNASQDATHLMIRSLIVNKGPAYRRYLPIARGRSRPIDKWTSHITVELGIDVGEEKVKSEKRKKKREEKKDESDIIYSESKPVGGDRYNVESASDDATPEIKEEHGHSTFQAQRKGSRGS